MVSLLGNENCITSLKSDVIDIQSTLVEVQSFVGPCKLSSWKYPDKCFGDVDMQALLPDLIYDKSDEEGNQYAHLLLLELTIDRFLYFLQIAREFLAAFIATCSDRTPNKQLRTKANSSSVGIVVSCFWKQLQSLKQNCQDLQSSAVNTSVEERPKSNKLSSNAKSVSIESAAVVKEFGGHDNSVVSKDVYSKSSQTVETSFVPCEACLHAQQCLKDTGDVLMSLCKDQSVPSSLERYRHLIDEQGPAEWLSATDVLHWTKEQNRDLQKLVKHFGQLAATVDPLRRQVEEQSSLLKDYQRNVAKLNRALNVEQEAALTKQNELKAEWRERCRQLEQSADSAASDKRQTAARLAELDTLHQEQLLINRNLQHTVGIFEKEKEELQSEVRRLTKELAELNAFRQNVANERSQLANIQTELDKAKARVTCLEKANEALLTKQKSLAEVTNMINKQNAELKRQAQELQEQLEAAEAKYVAADKQLRLNGHAAKDDSAKAKALSKEKEILERTITRLETDFKQLELQLAAHKERELLLLQYPDLNGPIPAEPDSGDIVKDMRNQLRANKLRIELLNQQNDSMQRSIAKLVEAACGHNALPADAVATEPLHGSRKEHSSPRDAVSVQPLSGGRHRHASPSSASMQSLRSYGDDQPTKVMVQQVETLRLWELPLENEQTKCEAVAGGELQFSYGGTWTPANTDNAAVTISRPRTFTKPNRRANSPSAVGVQTEDALDESSDNPLRMKTFIINGNNARPSSRTLASAKRPGSGVMNRAESG